MRRRFVARSGPEGRAKTPASDTHWAPHMRAPPIMNRPKSSFTGGLSARVFRLTNLAALTVSLASVGCNNDVSSTEGSSSSASSTGEAPGTTTDHRSAHSAPRSGDRLRYPDYKVQQLPHGATRWPQVRHRLHPDRYSADRDRRGRHWRVRAASLDERVIEDRALRHGRRWSFEARTGGRADALRRLGRGAEPARRRHHTAAGDGHAAQKRHHRQSAAEQ